jgi:hypothetical protein
MSHGRNIADDVIAVAALALDDTVIIVLPYGEDSRLRVVYGGFEARIWRDRYGYTYEIVSRGIVLARGEAESACAALERVTPQDRKAGRHRCPPVLALSRLGTVSLTPRVGMLTALLRVLS